MCATQREAARGLLWPSKLARIIPIDKPLLWIGPTTGAIAQSISGRPATGCFEPEAINEVVGWIQTLFNSPERSERLSPTEIDSVYRGLRGKGCSTWERWLMDLCKR